jgi:mercuric ion transport protein
MTTLAIVRKRSALLSYLSLFTSIGTLFCCALPSLFVLFGLGATVASVLSSVPWLVKFSEHKNWTFSIAGTMILLGFMNVYYVGPRLRGDVCAADDSNACDTASVWSKLLLWCSGILYATGVFVAFALGPILTRTDQG